MSLAPAATVSRSKPKFCHRLAGMPVPERVSVGTPGWGSPLLLSLPSEWHPALAASPGICSSEPAGCRARTRVGWSSP